MNNQILKENIIEELSALAEIGATDKKLVEQVKAGKFDEDIEGFDESYSLTDAVDSIVDYYKISKSSH